MANPPQVSPVLAVTVTAPDGLKVFAANGPTVKNTVTVCPTTEGLGEIAEIVVFVSAAVPVPLRLTVCSVSGTFPLLSWKNRLPVTGPVAVGANETSSLQKPPGASDKPRQCVVVGNPGVIPITEMERGCPPTFTRETNLGKLAVPTVWEPKLMLAADRLA